MTAEHDEFVGAGPRDAVVIVDGQVPALMKPMRKMSAEMVKLGIIDNMIEVIR